MHGTDQQKRRSFFADATFKTHDVDALQRCNKSLGAYVKSAPEHDKSSKWHSRTGTSIWWTTRAKSVCDIWHQFYFGPASIQRVGFWRVDPIDESKAESAVTSYSGNEQGSHFENCIVYPSSSKIWSYLSSEIIFKFWRSSMLYLAPAFNYWLSLVLQYSWTEPVFGTACSRGLFLVLPVVASYRSPCSSVRVAASLVLLIA